VDIQALLVEQVNFHEPAARGKNIAIRLETIPNLPLIPADRQGLDEVFTNLITNAVKYSPNGADITISVEVENDYLITKFSDTGFGIPGEDLDRIFSKFYRVKNQKTRVINGTGLGLSIVRSIVEAHHGKIMVESSEGEGSTFSVILPLADHDAIQRAVGPE